MIRLVVRSTAVLLALSSLLVIVGLFDLFLRWDIFGNKLESILYGVFFSLITLAAAGIALTFVLGIYEIVILLRASITNSKPPIGWGNTALVRAAIVAVLCVIAIVFLLGLLNSTIQSERHEKFRRLANVQAEAFVPKVSPLLSSLNNFNSSSKGLDDALGTLKSLDLLQNATVLMLDPLDQDAIVVHSISYNKPGVFTRKYVAKKHEVAAQSALLGNNDLISEYNESDHFEWLHSFDLGEGKRAVLHLVGSPTEDLREYE